ncbi:MAG TPA: hypothetical protein VNT75_14230 [Symbiobacteriaceae bacterium]|nr:hypothetical protein [Symbiobacteriaceae bacterium]
MRLLGVPLFAVAPRSGRTLSEPQEAVLVGRALVNGTLRVSSAPATSEASTFFPASAGATIGAGKRSRKRVVPPGQIQVTVTGAESQAAVTMQMGPYRPPTPDQLDVILQMIRGKTALEISQGREKGDSWASERFRELRDNLQADSLAEVIVKLVALGILSVQVIKATVK